MSDDVQFPVSLPLDSDGFLRRECPTCEQEFKWFSHAEGDPDAEVVDQYFCPMCGIPAGLDSWWTPEQLEYLNGVAAPRVDQYVEDALDDMFRGVKGLKVKKGAGFSNGVEAPDPLVEPNDMTIAEPPCHPNEPIKVPTEQLDSVHCLVCGLVFAA